MTSSNFFERLGAPLRNIRWSWGAKREDGSIVLKVWKDRVENRDGRTFVMLTHHAKYIHRQSHSGYRERNCHVRKIKEGAVCHMVMCEVVDLAAAPRKIRTFDQDYIYEGRGLSEYDGDYWIEIVEKLPASSFFIQ